MFSSGVDSNLKVWTDFYNYTIYPEGVFMKHLDKVNDFNIVMTDLNLELIFSSDSLGNCFLWSPTDLTIHGMASFPCDSFVIGNDKVCVGFYIKNQSGILRRRIYADQNKWDEMILNHYGTGFDNDHFFSKLNYSRSEWFFRKHGVGMALSKNGNYLSIYKRSNTIDFIDLHNFKVSYRFKLIDTLPRHVLFDRMSSDIVLSYNNNCLIIRCFEFKSPKEKSEEYMTSKYNKKNDLLFRGKGVVE